MYKNVFGSATLIILFGVFLRIGTALFCWDCNSLHDPRCADDPNNHPTLGVADCQGQERAHLNNTVAKYCRKIIQNIEGKTRVIRACGWLDEVKERPDCYSRTGTKDIMVTYCACEGDKCNSSTSVRTSWAIAGMLLLIVQMFQQRP